MKVMYWFYKTLYPSLIWHTIQPNPGYFHCFLLYYPFLYSISPFYSTGETAAGDKPGVSSPTRNIRKRQKLQPLKVGVYQILKRGLWEKIGCISYIRQYGIFPHSFFSFCLRRKCHLSFIDQFPTDPTAYTRQRHHHAAGVDSHLG